MVDNYAEILETSLKVIFNLFLVFGIEAFAEDDKDEKKKDQNGEVKSFKHLGLVSLFMSYENCLNDRH